MVGGYVTPPVLPGILLKPAWDFGLIIRPDLQLNATLHGFWSGCAIESLRLTTRLFNRHFMPDFLLASDATCKDDVYETCLAKKGLHRVLHCHDNTLSSGFTQVTPAHVATLLGLTCPSTVCASTETAMTLLSAVIAVLPTRRPDNDRFVLSLPWCLADCG